MEKEEQQIELDNSDKPIDFVALLAEKDNKIGQLEEKISALSSESAVKNKTISELDRFTNELADRLAQSFIKNVDVLGSVTSLSERFYDGSHSRFVAEKCVQVGEELGMEEEDIYELKIAALLHDIGKISFFDSALYKYVNEMTPMEYDHYVKHSEIGMQILKNHPDLSRVADIVYQHHEKLDGTGFPRNLSGDNILPSAKIIIVVDYFHNAVYKRPRNRANVPNSAVKFSNTKAFLEPTTVKFNFALNYLYKKRGILFEKKVVDVFIDIVQLERNRLGQKAIMRVPVNKLEAGMVFAEDYYSKFGMLIAAKGETVSKEMIAALVRFAENDQIPMKILVLK